MAHTTLPCWTLNTTRSRVSIHSTSQQHGWYSFDLKLTLSFSPAAGIAAKQNYSDLDIVHFLTNVECLEGQFDTWGTFG